MACHLNANGHLGELMPYATAFSSEEKLFAPLVGMAKYLFIGRYRALLQLIMDDWAKLTPQSAINKCLDYEHALCFANSRYHR